MPALDPHFTFLCEQLKEIYEDYSNYVFTTTATILLIIGWLLTSKDAQTFVSQHRWMRVAIYAAVVAFVLAEIWSSWGAYRHSRDVLLLIRTLLERHPDPAITPGYYMPKVIPGTAVVVLVLAHLVLYAVLCLVIRSLSPRRSAVPAPATASAEGPGA